MSYKFTEMQPQKFRAKADDDDEQQVIGSVRMYNKPIVVNSVDVYLDEPIGPLAYYRDLLHYMRSMEEGDELRIWIDTDGGYLDTALAIIDSMQNTQGDVMCIVSGNAKSAGGLIALAAPSLLIGDNATFMCHTATYGPGIGKANNVQTSVSFSTKTIESIVKKYYTGFLTEQEINDMLEGKDFWFDAEETRRRLDLRKDAQEKMLAELEAAAQAASLAAVTKPVQPKRLRKKQNTEQSK